jgi:acyl-CoA synthetase (AMP-forming)/AMP-acid ligase II
LAFCGAEVVRPDTLQKFADAFKNCGFNAAAFYPCYGLAEATLFVAGPAARRVPRIQSWDASALARGQALRVDASAQASRSLVACGQSFGHDLRVVDPEGCIELPESAVGEIWVRSSSVAGGGYWCNDALTDVTFNARLASDTGATTFLRTGDFGFVDEGDLFVTGRLKDLIIVRGLNHAPTDIELTVEECHPAFRQGGCAAFSIDVAGEERLVLAQEIERTQRQFDAAHAIDRVRESVARAHGLTVHDLVFVRHASLPRTSSGKLQRYLCAQRYLDKTLDAVRPRIGVASSEPARGGDLEATKTGEVI